MSISIFMAAALMAAPTRKATPPSNMTAWRPTAFVKRPATSDAANPAIYKEEVKAVRTSLSKMQYSSCLASAIFLRTLGKKGFRNDSMAVTPPEEPIMIQRKPADTAIISNSNARTEANQFTQ